MKPTPKTIKALKIIRDNKIEMPGQFARLMWPESEGWRVFVKTGHGSSRGRQMPMAGGAYLAKLVRAGFAERFTYIENKRFDKEWRLTRKGKEILQESEKEV